nr:zinc-ribbon domain-containing protein [Modestobacter muralis]
MRRPARGAAAYADDVFFLFGFGTKQRDLGPGAVRTCPNCGNTSTWARVQESRQLTVFFVPVARWGRRQLEVCTICSTAVEV